jgi:hypothetical protein
MHFPGVSLDPNTIPHPDHVPREVTIEISTNPVVPDSLRIQKSLKISLDFSHQPCSSPMSELQRYIFPVLFVTRNTCSASQLACLRLQNVAFHAPYMSRH